MSLQIPTLNVPVLSAVIAGLLPEVKSLAPEAPVAPNNKRFVIVHTKDISKEDLANFQSYGQVVEYDFNVEANIAIDNLVFDYLFINLHDKKSRIYFDMANLENYNLIAYISFIETHDNYVDVLGAQNVLTSFPSRVHFKASFDTALLQTSTSAPSTCLSLINFASSFLGSLKRAS